MKLPASMQDKLAVATALVALGHADNLGGLSAVQYKILKALRASRYTPAFVEDLHLDHPNVDRVTFPTLIKRGLITVKNGETEITPIGLLTVARKQRLEREARARRPY